MNSLLDDLWYSYQLEKNAHTTDEEKVLLSHTVQAGDVLYGELSTDQINLLEEYLLLQGQLNSLCEKKAYHTGICFVFRLLTEALLPGYADRIGKK